LKGRVFLNQNSPAGSGDICNASFIVIGGTGVVTIGAILAMAAHLEGRGASTLDFTGLAQKNGAVMSHVRLAPAPEQLHAVRIAPGGADLVVGARGSKVNLAVFGNNVTNESYRIGVLGLIAEGLGIESSVYGEPRMYGVEVSYRF